MFEASSRYIETFMIDEVQFYRGTSKVPYLTTKARIQPRRNVGQRNLMGHDVVQEQFVQLQMPVSVSTADIRVDDTVVVSACAMNPDLLGRPGSVVDVMNASHLIEFTVGAWFDLQRERRKVGAVA